MFESTHVYITLTPKLIAILCQGYTFSPIQCPNQLFLLTLGCDWLIKSHSQHRFNSKQLIPLWCYIFHYSYVVNLVMVNGRSTIMAMWIGCLLSMWCQIGNAFYHYFSFLIPNLSHKIYLESSHCQLFYEPFHLKFGHWMNKL